VPFIDILIEQLPTGSSAGRHFSFLRNFLDVVF